MILSGLVSLGMTAAVPSMSQAAAAPEKRHESRHIEARHEEHRDFHHDREFEHREIHRDFIRRDYRPIYEHGYYERAPVIVEPPVVVDPGYTDVAVSIGQVPPPVLDAANRLTGGAPITGVDFVHLPGARFYDVHVATPNGYQTLRFGINGGFYGYR